MTKLDQIIQGRRSIRKYADRPIPSEMLEQIMEAVRWSPSWANTQCWEVVVVQDPEKQAALQATLPPKGNPAIKAIAQAPAVLALCARKNASGYYKGMALTPFGDWMMYDLGLATQNLCLMAHHLGLGTVVVGVFDHARAGALLGVPHDHQLVTLIPLGFPAKVGAAPKRRETTEFVHYDQW